MSEVINDKQMQEKIDKAIKEFGFNIYSLEEYNYNLPEELIAQSPAEKRDESRLLVLDKATSTLEDKHFYDIINYFRKEYSSISHSRSLPVRHFILFYFPFYFLKIV